MCVFIAHQLLAHAEHIAVVTSQDVTFLRSVYLLLAVLSAGTQ